MSNINRIQKNIIEIVSNKKILSAKENVTLHKNNKKFTYKARIDSGARNTSIDLDVAEKIGLKNIKNLLKEINQNKFESRKEADTYIKNVTKDIQKKYTYVLKLDSVKSSHGISIRPIVKIKMTLKEVTISTKTNVYDRSKMSFPILVGRNILKNFIIIV